MGRSNWKGPYSLIKKEILEKNYSQFRNHEITPNIVNQILQIHNGKDFKELTITKDMIGHKFGEFAFTRVKFVYKKKKVKKK